MESLPTQIQLLSRPLLMSYVNKIDDLSDEQIESVLNEIIKKVEYIRNGF